MGLKACKDQPPQKMEADTTKGPCKGREEAHSNPLGSGCENKAGPPPGKGVNDKETEHQKEAYKAKCEHYFQKGDGGTSSKKIGLKPDDTNPYACGQLEKDGQCTII